jgi:hypothetical protein
VKTWELLYRNHADSTPEGLNIRRMLADAVIGQLCDMREISAGMIASATLRTEFLNELSARMRSEEANLDEWRNRVKLSMGLITQEQIDAANQQKEQLLNEAAASNQNVIIKKNTSNLRGGKTTNRYDFDPGNAGASTIRGPTAELLSELKMNLRGCRTGRSITEMTAIRMRSWWGAGG